MQFKKGTHVTPCELWYGYAPNVKYFKVFGRKCYILEGNRNGKLDAKSDAGIFLGYSNKSKSYKSLNSNTNKVVKSTNVRVDEYAKKNEVEYKKELEDCTIFVYIYEGDPYTLL